MYFLVFFFWFWFCIFANNVYNGISFFGWSSHNHYLSLEWFSLFVIVRFIDCLYSTIRFDSIRQCFFLSRVFFYLNMLHHCDLLLRFWLQTLKPYRSLSMQKDHEIDFENAKKKKKSAENASTLKRKEGWWWEKRKKNRENVMNREWNRFKIAITTTKRPWK